MVLEITAARLLAPYVGVSLYTWTSIIGVILGGLSLGSWLGGRWADRGGSASSAAVVLSIAGLACLAVLSLMTWLAPPLQALELGALSASLIFVAGLFFLPAVLLGIITPLLTTLALRLDSRTGHVVGRMHALAALGSILGTFVAGYGLIQWFGTRTVILGTGFILLVLALPFWGRRNVYAAPIAALLAVAVLWMTQVRQGFAEPCDQESRYFCIRVIEHGAVTGSIRALVLDHLLHGINDHENPTLLHAPYVHLMDELIDLHLGTKLDQARLFYAGGGAYSLPRAIQARAPSAVQVIAELDQEVTAMAQQALFLSPAGLQIQHRDARRALQAWQGEAFDVVVGDVFHDIAVPYHLVTLEYARLVKSRLQPGGLYLLNLVDAWPDPRLIAALVKTLREVFGQVEVWLDYVPLEPTRATYVLVAADDFIGPAELRSRRGLRRSWQRITDRLPIHSARPDIPLLTDDYVPVERLVARLLTTAQGQ